MIDDISKMTIDELSRAYHGLEDLFMGFVKAMVNALEAKSSWTRGHSERVTAFAQEIAYEMKLEESARKEVIMGSLLHDIGKIGTYGTILDKDSELTEQEFEDIKLHPVKGAEILRGITQFENIALIVRHHHEEVDGTGYPDGLKGAQIPMGARIVYVADAFDAMTEERPYRPGMGMERAAEELLANAGTQFDPVVVQAWLSVLERQKARLSEFKRIAARQ